MSWHFSRALVEDCLRLMQLAGEQSALSSWTCIADVFFLSDRMTECYDHSRYGMTFVHLTAERGVASLILCLEDSLAKHSALLHQEKISPMIFGLRCLESWQMSLPGTSLQKTYQGKQSTGPLTTANRWVTKQDAQSFQRNTWVLTTYGQDIGYLHTPTTKANYCAESMQKWPSCRAWRQVFGKVTPESHEYLMGWPIGWTDLKPLEMVKFRLWQSMHYWK